MPSSLPSSPPPPSISITDLTYQPSTASTPLLTSLTLSLPPRSRTLLIGANGAGKTTLLRLLAGKRLCPTGAIAIGGRDPFSEGLEGVTYLGVEWVLNPIVRTDIGVPELLDSVGGKHYPERRQELIEVLDIDLRWRMHTVSDGERRRVQLAMGLVRPWTILLLDEVTVDLDLLSRYEFLSYLKREAERRECTVVYATHILDNLVGWPTHLVHMCGGKVKESGKIGDFRLDGTGDEGVDVDRSTKGVAEQWGKTGNSRLGELVLSWLREDLQERGPRNQEANGTEDGELVLSNEPIGGFGFESRKK